VHHAVTVTEPGSAERLAMKWPLLFWLSARSWVDPDGRRGVCGDVVGLVHGAAGTRCKHAGRAGQGWVRGGDDRCRADHGGDVPDVQGADEQDETFRSACCLSRSGRRHISGLSAPGRGDKQQFRIKASWPRRSAPRRSPPGSGRVTSAAMRTTAPAPHCGSAGHRRIRGPARSPLFARAIAASAFALAS
jgi:hypothetical protein